MLRRSINFWNLCLAGFILLLAGCSKSEKEEQYVYFEVLEYKTNIPLPGVQIKLFRCFDYDIEFGCRAIIDFATAITDENGKASVSQSIYNRMNEGIQFSKAGYFTTNGYAGTVYLNRQGTVNTRIVPGTTIYPNCHLFITASNDRYSFQVLDLIPIPSSPIDITIKAIDGQVNTFKWQIVEQYWGGGSVKKSGEISNISIPYNGILTINL